MESIEEIDLLFKSGNDVPVTRATITLEQWEAVKAEVRRLDDEFEAMAVLMRNKGGEDDRA